MSDETPTPAPARVDLVTMKARIVCSCGWTVSSRGSDAAIAAYNDHLQAVHATGVLVRIGPAVPA